MSLLHLLFFFPCIFSCVFSYLVSINMLWNVLKMITSLKSHVQRRFFCLIFLPFRCCTALCFTRWVPVHLFCIFFYSSWICSHFYLCWGKECLLLSCAVTRSPFLVHLPFPYWVGEERMNDTERKQRCEYYLLLPLYIYCIYSPTLFSAVVYFIHFLHFLLALCLLSFLVSASNLSVHLFHHLV